MKVLVLGASGFIGSWAARALDAAGAETTVLARPSSDLWRLGGVSPSRIVRADAADWGEAIANVLPEVVVSLEWSGVAGADHNAPSQWANVARQAEILKAAALTGCRRFVGVGSHAEYGPKDLRIAETERVEPRTEYGKAKLAAMQSSRDFCEANGIEWAWARVFSTYGPLDNSHWLLPIIADALLANTSIELTTGEQTWSYLSGSDAGTAMATLAMHPQSHGIYNVGDPTAPVLRGTIESFAAHFDSPGHLLFGAKPFGPDPVMRLESNVTRLMGLGWSPAIPIEEGLAASARWLQGAILPDPLLKGRSLPIRPH